MPIYEYQCNNCDRQFQSLVMRKEEAQGLLCPRCGSRNLKRLVSRVTYHASERDRLDSFDPSAQQSDSFYRDSRNIGLHAKKRAQQMGVDLGSSFEEKVEKLRTDPGSVIKDND
jgi:putative FmdB family regulatory protein